MSRPWTISRRRPSGVAALAAGCACLILVLSGGCPEPGPGDNQNQNDNTDPGLPRLVRVADGFVAPVFLTHPGDDTGRLFVVDQVGTVRVIDADGSLLDEPFLDVRDRMVEIGIDFGNGVVFDERGLLSLAFHPDYAANGRLFVVYNAPADDGEEGVNSVLTLSEFAVSDDDPNQADPDSERVILEIDKPQFNHNGGQIAFGPDGYLYMGTGDGGGANDTDEGHTPELGNGQDRSQLLGKILRIDIDGDEPYEIPADNPLVGAESARAELWAWGLRNPWRFSFDDDGNLLVADVGQDRLEEVNIVTGGGNYGWNIREGDDCFDPQNPTMPPDECPATGASGEALIDPIIVYPHPSVLTDEQEADDVPAGLAVVGGYVYRGAARPELVGDYIFADWSSVFTTPDGFLLAASRQTAVADEWTVRRLAVEDHPDGRIGRFILGFGEDADGEIYVCTSDNVGPTGTTGGVFRIE